MKILGIESSCDETAAVVADGREILSSVVTSQIDIHWKYGGVVPELASREHLRQIVPVVREALAQAGIMLADVDAMGVTQARDLSARCWACALVQEKQTNWNATADRKTFLAGRLQ